MKGTLISKAFLGSNISGRSGGGAGLARLDMGPRVETAHECTSCDYCCTTLDLLGDHIETHRPPGRQTNNRFEMPCPFGCGRYASVNRGTAYSLTEMDTHVKVWHPNEKKAQGPGEKAARNRSARKGKRANDHVRPARSRSRRRVQGA